MSVPTIQRTAYFNGQRLSAADLTDAQDSAREMRWLHNMSLHGWGIATGLQVSGKIGDRAVTVAPGYAIDSSGREIVLGASAVSNVPAVVGSTSEVQYYLIASWLSDSSEKVLQSRDGACSGSGAVRLKPTPSRIAWRSQKDVRPGVEIILAEVWIRNCRLSRAISSASRRYARPTQQPYVASGQTDASTLAWTAWPGGLQADVDTSSAQFGVTPQYFAQLTGERYLVAAPGPLIALPFAAAAKATSTGFTLQVLLPQGPGIVNPAAVRDPAQASDIAQELNWQVVWVGVED